MIRFFEQSETAGLCNRRLQIIFLNYFLTLNSAFSPLIFHSLE